MESDLAGCRNPWNALVLIFAGPIFVITHICIDFSASPIPRIFMPPSRIPRYPHVRFVGLIRSLDRCHQLTCKESSAVINA